MPLLPVQLHILLNASLFKVFNLPDHRSFTIAHLRTTLGSSFHISPDQIILHLLSGRFTRDHHALFDLRTTDGSWASLDVELSTPHVQSSLSNAVISFSYASNVNPLACGNTLSDGILEVSAPTRFLPSSSSSSPASLCWVDFSREQRIALRAQREDPFSIASKSCFEDDSDEEDDDANQNNHSDSDVDDDLYSDDGEAVSESAFAGSDCLSTPSSPMFSPLTSPTGSSFWPSDPSKLTTSHLRHMLSIVPPCDRQRETPLRNSLLRYTFQRRILERLEHASSFIPTNALENLKLTSAPHACLISSPATPAPSKTVPASSLRDTLHISFP